MEIRTVSSFLDYFEKIRRRTLRVARCIPADLLEWTYAPGKFTFDDVLRHLATIERYMYADFGSFWNRRNNQKSRARTDWRGSFFC